MSGKDIHEMMQEMTDLPAPLSPIDQAVTNRSVFDPIHLNVDPRLFDSYGRVEKRKLPPQAPLDLPVPTFRYYKEMVDVNEQKQQRLNLQLMEVERERIELARLKLQQEQLNKHAYRQGFEAGKKLTRSLQKLEATRCQDIERELQKLRIFQQERSTSKSAHCMLKPTRRSRKNRFEAVVATPALANTDRVPIGSLSRDWEIVESPEEAGNGSALPEATFEEVTAAASAQQAATRQSRVNDSNSHLLPSFLSESSSSEEEEFSPVPDRRPLADVGNQQLIKVVNAPPVDPVKRKNRRRR